MEIKNKIIFLGGKLALCAFFIFSATLTHAGWGYVPELRKTLDKGVIEGVEANHNTHAFLGIPYAAPPIGELRWRAPQAPASWDGVLEAKTFGNICPQNGSVWGTTDPSEFSTPIGNEDCLYLNVWRPNNARTNLPVLLWIHGGSGIRGSADFSAYDGAYFAQQANAVVVSINYRLGALGWLFNSFLDDGDLENASGNYALLDMVKSLSWVQENIRAFGGNPRKVTIAGNSSGCADVWGLLQTPLSEGLFHRAICSSGFPTGTATATGQYLSDFFVDQLLVGFGLAADVEAAAALRETNGPEWVAGFMRSVPADVFSSAVAGVPALYTDGYVLPESGYEALQAGVFHKVPLMIGGTADEATYILGALGGFFNAKGGSSDPLLWEQLNSDPATLTYDDIVDPALPIFEETHTAYSYAWNLALDNVAKQVRIHHPRVYRYNFNWNDLPGPWDEALGAMHTLDLPFLFGNFVTEEENVHRFAWSDENEVSRRELSDRFIGYVSRFMRFGNPNRFRGQTRWPRWNNFEHVAIPLRIQLDDEVTHSAERFNFEDYTEMLEELDPWARTIVESSVSSLPLQ